MCGHFSGFGGSFGLDRAPEANSSRLGGFATADGRMLSFASFWGMSATCPVNT